MQIIRRPVPLLFPLYPAVIWVLLGSWIKELEVELSFVPLVILVIPKYPGSAPSNGVCVVLRWKQNISGTFLKLTWVFVVGICCIVSVFVQNLSVSCSDFPK